MDLLPQAPAILTPREPPGKAPHHCDSDKPVVSQNIPVEVSLRITKDEEAGSSAATERKAHTGEALGAPIQAVPDVSPAVGLVEASCYDDHKQTGNLNCTHINFPSCDCVAQAAKHRPTHGRLGRRAGRRHHRGPSLAALRDSSLEAFDENEESDFQESETETDTQLADITDAESDCTAGLESDVEGAVGGPELLAPPDIPGGRRASIVTTDSRHDEILTAPEPIKVAVFGTDGVGKSGECSFKRVLQGINFLPHNTPQRNSVMAQNTTCQHSLDPTHAPLNFFTPSATLTYPPHRLPF